MHLTGGRYHNNSWIIVTKTFEQHFINTFINAWYVDKIV